MYRIRQYIRQFLMPAMLIAFAFIAVSCNDDSGDSPGLPEEGESFEMRFQICSRMLPGDSRADESPLEEQGSVAENIIDLDDITYHLFDRNGGYLLTLKPTATKTTVISTDYALYDVVAKIYRDQDKTNYFKENWTGQVDFYILAFANHTPYLDAPLPTLNTGDPMASLFNTDPIVLKGLPDTETIMHPYKEGDAAPRHIPMAGLQYFSLSGSWFETQTGEAPINLTALTGKSLNMLRTVAKLEVIDRINIPEGQDYNEEKDADNIRIANVVINGVMTTSRLLPSEDQWEKNSRFETLQVALPSVTDVDDYLNPPSLNESTWTISTDGTESTPAYGLDFEFDEAATLKREDKCRVYSCYIWEYSRLAGIQGVKCPYLSVTVRNPNPDETETFHIRLMSGMSANAISLHPVDALLRNHIYRYEIAGTATDMNIKWSVCPMDEAKTDITFN